MRHLTRKSTKLRGYRYTCPRPHAFRSSLGCCLSLLNLLSLVLRILEEWIHLNFDVDLSHLRKQVRLSLICKDHFILLFEEIVFELPVPSHLSIPLVKHGQDGVRNLVLNLDWLVLVDEVLHSVEVNLVHLSSVT